MNRVSTVSRPETVFSPEPGYQVGQYGYSLQVDRSLVGLLIPKTVRTLYIQFREVFFVLVTFYNVGLRPSFVVFKYP